MEALKKAIDAFVNAFKIEDLRKKLLFTLGILIIYRIGAHITIPGVNSAVLAEFFRNSNNLFAEVHHEDGTSSEGQGSK